MVWKVPIFYRVYILREDLSVQFQLIQKVNSTIVIFDVPENKWSSTDHQ